MLSCEQVTDKLSAQIDGDLSLSERTALRVHQFLCSDCKAAAQNMRSLVQSLRDRSPAVIAEEDTLHNDYVDQVMRALEREGATSGSVRDSVGQDAD